MRPKNLKIALTGLVFFLLTGFVVVQGVRQTWVYYYTPSELMDRATQVDGRVVKTSGTVVPGTVHKSGLTLDFKIAEEGETLAVAYRGAVPDAFTDGVPVVVEGTFHAPNRMEAKTLMTKCPSRYEEDPANKTKEGG